MSDSSDREAKGFAHGRPAILALGQVWTLDQRVLYNTAMKIAAATKLKQRRSVAKRTGLKGTSAHLIGALRGKMRVTGDIMSTGRKWHAQS